MLYIGIDGGATHCRARIADDRGQVLGQGRAGSANVTTDPDGALAAILEASNMAAADGNLDSSILSDLHAGLGLAGADLDPAIDRRVESALPFAQSKIVLDGHTACLGAHGGRDGAIISLGTGSIGIAVEAGRLRSIGGWGFALSDMGSGATLGRAVLRQSLAAHEGLAASSPLTAQIMEHFGHDPKQMVIWAKSAGPSDYAKFVPQIFAAARATDPVALTVLGEAAEDVVLMADRLLAGSDIGLCIVGGLADPIMPYFPAPFRERLLTPKGDALEGALWLARQETSP